MSFDISDIFTLNGKEVGLEWDGELLLNKANWAPFQLFYIISYMISLDSLLYNVHIDIIRLCLFLHTVYFDMSVTYTIYLDIAKSCLFYIPFTMT